MHRISDTRVGGTSKRNLRMFQKICGQKSFENVVIVTTMWDKVTLKEGEQREQELKSSDDLFKPLIDGGAIMKRYDGTSKSACNIIRDLFRKNDTVARIAHELIVEKKNLLDTEAGMELQTDLRNVLQKHQQDLQTLADEIMEAKQRSDKNTENEVAADRGKVLEDISKLHREFEKLGNTSGTDVRCVLVLCAF